MACIVAYNYFAFRVELFSEEDEQNHPVSDPWSHQTAFSPSTLNWETFDKDNAPKALTVSAGVQVEMLGYVYCPQSTSVPSSLPEQPVRDKSPPISLFS